MDFLGRQFFFCIRTIVIILQGIRVALSRAFPRQGSGGCVSMLSHKGWLGEKKKKKSLLGPLPTNSVFAKLDIQLKGLLVSPRKEKF